MEDSVTEGKFVTTSQLPKHNNNEETGEDYELIEKTTDSIVIAFFLAIAIRLLSWIYQIYYPPVK